MSGGVDFFLVDYKTKNKIVALSFSVVLLITDWTTVQPPNRETRGQRARERERKTAES